MNDLDRNGLKEITPIPPHQHNGVDSLKIDPRNLKGFPVLTVAPTHIAPEGSIVFLNDAGTYYLYAYINSTWVKVVIAA
jgi:hypothetical protein